MSDAAELIRAIAALAWPILGAVALRLYHREIRNILSRIRRGKILGQEVELEDTLTKLDASANAGAAEAAAIPQPPKARTLAALKSQAPDITRKVFDDSAQSPKAALLRLASELERELRVLSRHLGVVRDDDARSGRQLLKLIAQAHALPSHVLESINLFWAVRNRLVHGQDTSPDDVFRAIDSGVTILEALSSIPYAIHRVYHPGVPIYADAAASQLRPGVLGVILDNEMRQGAGEPGRTIFPTTRTYSKGQLLSWEWNLALVISESWYRDPDTGEVRSAWTQAGEFTGRVLPDP